MPDTLGFATGVIWESDCAPATVGFGVAYWSEFLCWNSLSPEQQESQRIRNFHEGEPEGECRRPAEVAVETSEDAAPGPRLYCRPCGIRWLAVRR